MCHLAVIVLNILLNATRSTEVHDCLYGTENCMFYSMHIVIHVAALFIGSPMWSNMNEQSYTSYCDVCLKVSPQIWHCKERGC
jgi:hypothetical protein